MEQSCEDLLDYDCWEFVFKKLRKNRCDIASLSLVCRTFLSITNGIKYSFRTSYLITYQFIRLLQRFPQLKSVHLRKTSYGEIICLINHMSRSGLQLKSLRISFAEPRGYNGLQGLGMEMKTLQKLTITTPSYDDELISLADIFPCLEKLKINGANSKYCTSPTDDGIEALSLKLKRLVKISLMRCREITDKSLISLSSNCLNLTNIKIVDCLRLTENGVGLFMRHSSMLTSFSLNLRHISLGNGEHGFTKNSISYARKLEEIKLYGMEISDAVLCSIARVCHLLKKVYFFPRSSENNFTILGLKMLMMANPNLEHFRPGIKWITDESMIEISQQLSSLTYINLNRNIELSSATFFMLAKTCPLLEEIHMDSTSVGTCDHLLSCLHTNYRVKFLSIRSCKSMNDRVLKTFVRVCPNIETLFAQDCPLLTDDGISEIVRICPEMRLLDVSNLNVSNFFGMNDGDGKLRLQTIFASKTNIDDECMILIGMRCPDLEVLDINNCQRVTSHGVKEVVKNCKKIKKIIMNTCQCVSFDLLVWMVNSRPSLEHIFLSRQHVISGNRNLFWRNGSYILKSNF